MVIRASAAREIGRLLTDLESGSSIQRETAIARLAIIGPRAVERLLILLRKTRISAVRSAILRTLEAIGDKRALIPALRSLRDKDNKVGTAAVGVVRSHIWSKDSEASETALDRLVAIALDSRGKNTIRLAAIDALTEIPQDVISPILVRLKSDKNTQIRKRAETWRGKKSKKIQAPNNITATGKDSLPDNPTAFRELIDKKAPTMPLATLHRLLGVIKEREDQSTESARIKWMTARASVHRVLTARGSRVALYELRETLSSARRPLPVGFLTAISEAGDASCLDALATAYTRTTPSKEAPWWHEQLREAFQLIYKRERLTRRHRVIKRFIDRWPDISDELIISSKKKAGPLLGSEPNSISSRR